MNTKKAIELILMPKVFYTFKELKSKISILFSILSKYWKLENKPFYLAYARTVGSWSNGISEFYFLKRSFRISLFLNFQFLRPTVTCFVCLPACIFQETKGNQVNNKRHFRSLKAK